MYPNKVKVFQIVHQASKKSNHDGVRPSCIELDSDTMTAHKFKHKSLLDGNGESIQSIVNFGETPDINGEIDHAFKSVSIGIGRALGDKGQTLYRRRFESAR